MTTNVNENSIAYIVTLWVGIIPSNRCIDLSAMHSLTSPLRPTIIANYTYTHSHVNYDRNIYVIDAYREGEACVVTLEMCLECVDLEIIFLLVDDAISSGFPIPC